MPPKSAGKSREIVLRSLPGPNDACKDGGAADGGPQGHAFSQKRGGGHGAVIAGHLGHEEAVGRPAKGCADGQQVSHGRYFQTRAVEDHEGHSGERQDGVLCEEIEGSAGNAQDQEHQFVLPAEPQLPIPSRKEDVQPDAGVGQDKADEENGNRMHPRADEDFGGDERHASHRNHCQRKKMILNKFSVCHRE